MTLARLVFRLRPEEAVALAFLLPTTWLTLAAYVYAREAGVLGPRYPGGVVRLGAVLVLLAGLALALWRFPGSAAVRGLRETVPLLACFLIYTNLHDTIGFVNPHDVHLRLVALDDALFGVQPCVWAERFISQALTELMQFLYLSFFWIAPSTSLVLLLQGRWPEFRAATFGIVTCFFMGYALYVAFPAAPPRLVLVYAWRHVRPWFFALLPFVIGLWASTIYLRHHYFVDLVAGWLLAGAAVRLAPRVDRWWARQQLALGYEPARGARAQ